MSKNIGVTIRRIYRNKGIKVSVKDHPPVDGQPETFSVTLANDGQAADFEATRVASWPNSTSTSDTSFTLTSDTAAPVKVEREKKEKVQKEKKEKVQKEKKEKKGKAPKVDLANDTVSDATAEALAEYEEACQDVELSGEVPNTLADFKAKSIIGVEVDETRYTFVRLSTRLAWEVRTPGEEALRVTPEVGFKTYKGMMGRGGEVKFVSNT